MGNICFSSGLEVIKYDIQLTVFISAASFPFRPCAPLISISRSRNSFIKRDDLVIGDNDDDEAYDH